MLLIKTARVAKQTFKKMVLGGLAFVIGTSSLMVAAPLFLSQTAYAATLNVCASGCTYSTIQAAVNAASAGDVITVSAGTYNENVSISKNLTLNGAQAGVSGSSHSGAESVITSISITNANVIVDGFKVDPGAGGQDTGLRFEGTSGSNAVRNSVFTDYESSAVFWATGTGAFDFSNNLLTNTTGTDSDGLQVQTGVTSSLNSTIKNNVFTNASAGGADIQLSFGAATGTVISGNISTGGATLVTLFNMTNSQVTNNSFAGDQSYSGSIIYVGGADSSTTISGNDLSGSAGGAVTIANAFGYGVNSGTTITNNNLHGSVRGISIGAGSMNAGETAVAHQNTITNNTLGARNLSDGSLNATNNYWGAADSGSVAALIAGTSVTYDPWYTNAAKTSLSNSTVTDATYSSTTSGQADLPSGVTTVTLDDTHKLDVNGGVNTVSGGNIVVGGTSQSLSGYSGGDLSNINLSNSQTIGDQSVVVAKAVTLQSGTNSQPIVLTNTQLSNVSVSIQDSTTILAASNWDGTIAPPTTVSTAGTTAPSGFSVGSTAIEVGSPDTVLLFDKPVIVQLDGVTGQVGYLAAHSTTWVTIPACTIGTYASPDFSAVTFPGACSLTDGTNTKILTYHFTTFASLVAATPTPTSSDNSSSSSSTTPASSSTTAKNQSSNANSQVLGEATTSNGQTSSTSTTAPVAVAATKATSSGKFLGIQWYFWLIGLAALAVVGLSTYYIANSGSSSKK